MEKFIKFEIGILIGTVIGAAVSALICSVCFSAFGFDATNIMVIQECLEEELNIDL